MIAAAAPAILDAAPTSSAATPSGAKTGNAAGFDAILLLQSLAGTAETLDTATFEAGDTADALATDDSPDDEDTDDIEASLAFLSALLSATTPPADHGA